MNAPVLRPRSRSSLPTIAALRQGIFGVALIGAALCIWAVSGCGKPGPDLRYSTKEEVVTPTGKDLGHDASITANEGFTPTRKTPTFDRFPVGLAVVKVAAAVGEDPANRYLRVLEMPPDRAVHWNHFVDDLPTVREVTLLGTMGLDPRGARCEDLLRSAIRNECGLCVVYSLIIDTNVDAEFIATLWDAESGELLATFHVPATLPPDVRKVYLKDDDESELDKDEIRNLHLAAEYHAESKLRTIIRDALWDLSDADEKSKDRTTSPWRNKLPLFPRDYRRTMEVVPRNPEFDGGPPLPLEHKPMEQPQSGEKVETKDSQPSGENTAAEPSDVEVDTPASQPAERAEDLPVFPRDYHRHREPARPK